MEFDRRRILVSLWHQQTGGLAYNTRQKYENEIERNIQINDQKSLEVMWSNIAYKEEGAIYKQQPTT